MRMVKSVTKIVEIHTGTCRTDFCERCDGRILCSRHMTMHHNVCPWRGHRKLHMFATIVRWLNCYCCCCHCFAICPTHYFVHWLLGYRPLHVTDSKRTKKQIILKKFHSTFSFFQKFFVWLFLFKKEKKTQFCQSQIEKMPFIGKMKVKKKF